MMHLTCTNMPVEKLKEALEKVGPSAGGGEGAGRALAQAACSLPRCSSDRLLCEAWATRGPRASASRARAALHHRQRSQVPTPCHVHSTVPLRRRPAPAPLGRPRRRASATSWRCAATRPRGRSSSRRSRAALPAHWTWSSTSGSRWGAGWCGAGRQHAVLLFWSKLFLPGPPGGRSSGNCCARPAAFSASPLRAQPPTARCLLRCALQHGDYFGICVSGYPEAHPDSIVDDAEQARPCAGLRGAGACRGERWGMLGMHGSASTKGSSSGVAAEAEAERLGISSRHSNVPGRVAMAHATAAQHLLHALCAAGRPDHTPPAAKKPARTKQLAFPYCLFLCLTTHLSWSSPLIAPFLAHPALTRPSPSLHIPLRHPPPSRWRGNWAEVLNHPS